MGFFDFLKWLFGVRPKEEKYLTRYPPVPFEELVKYINKKVLQENTRLKAENIKLRKKLEEKKAKERAEKEKKKIEREILKKKKQMELIEKERTLPLKIETKKANPTFFLRSNTNVGKFVGFLLQDTKEGHTLWYPMIKTKNGIFKLNVYSLNPLDFFRSRLSIVAQLKGGKLDSNVDVTKDGKLVIIKDNPEEGEDVETKQKVKLIHLDEHERREYEQKIAELREKIKELYSALETAKEKEAEYELQLADKEMAAKAAMKQRDTFAALSSHLIEKSGKQTEEMARMASAVQDLKVDQVLTERLAFGFFSALDGLQEKFKKYLGADRAQMALDEVKRVFNEALEYAKKFQKPVKVEVEQPKKGLFGRKPKEETE